MSAVFGSVMERLAAGQTPREAARSLGIAADLALTIAEEATRLGLLVGAGQACGTCVPASRPACAGCPLASLR